MVVQVAFGQFHGQVAWLHLIIPQRTLCKVQKIVIHNLMIAHIEGQPEIGVIVEQLTEQLYRLFKDPLSHGDNQVRLLQDGDKHPGRNLLVPILPAQQYLSLFYPAGPGGDNGLHHHPEAGKAVYHTFAQTEGHGRDTVVLPHRIQIALHNGFILLVLGHPQGGNGSPQKFLWLHLAGIVEQGEKAGFLNGNIILPIHPANDLPDIAHNLLLGLIVHIAGQPQKTHSIQPEKQHIPAHLVGQIPRQLA